jgi:23S rRNA pseudouridine1911/1915/1917 synthase
MRIDKYLAETYPNFSRRQIQKLVNEGKVVVGGRRVESDFNYSTDMVLKFDMPVSAPSRTQAESLTLKVVSENENFMVIDKPSGLVVHPGSGNASGTVVNALLAYLGKKESSNERIGIVHRLDKDTSGLLLLAKNERTESELKQLFRDRQVRKEYLALVSGRMAQPAGEINRPLGRLPKGGLRFVAGSSGKYAQTRYFTEKAYDADHTLLRVLPTTGRTHQIRVHLKSIGHPVVGDSLYGGEQSDRLFLHATGLFFKLNGVGYEFESPLPSELRKVLGRLK